MSEEVKQFCPKCGGRKLTILCDLCDWHNGGERSDLFSWSDEDQSLPEDEQIQAAFPMETGDHKSYEEAMRLVGAKRSKAALVDLVNWLLHRLNKVETCGMKRTLCPENIESGHIEYETLTECGEDIACFDECWQSWTFCPFCGKPWVKK